MSVIHVNKENFAAQVLESGEPVLLDFWAPWCGPCRMVGPILDAIAEENHGIRVCKINVDEEPELASRYGVMSIPSLFAIKGGKIVNQAVGAMPKEQILALFR